VTRTSIIPAGNVPTADAVERCQFDVVVGRAGLEQIRDDWKHITRTLSSARFCQLYEWYESYLETLAPADATLHFFRARRHGVPVAIFPLLHTTRNIGGLRLRSLELPQHPHMLLSDGVFAPSDANGTLLGDLLAELRRTRIAWDVLCLPNLLGDGCLDQTLTATPRRLTLTAETARCDYLPCIPFEELAQNFSKNFRGNLRKARNKLARAADVQYLTARQPSELATALVDFLAVEASGWKGTSGTGSAIKLNPDVCGFYEALSTTFGRRGACEINLLRVAGQCIAGQFCLLAGDTSFMLKIGYDESFAELAPGNMLIEHTLRRYEQAGVVKCVNLVTDADWHGSWKPQSLAVLDVRLFNTSAAGLSAFLVLSARRRLGKLHRAHIAPMIDRWKNRAKRHQSQTAANEAITSETPCSDGAR
jgi:CelD/BcsL family acetyltransferase involved in cellulose biosynthesis